MTKLLQIVPDQVLQEESVANILKEVQERIAEGGVLAIAVALVTTKGINTSFSETEHGPELLGATTLLTRRVLQEFEDPS